jgi:uncharacterized protein YqhQ
VRKPNGEIHTESHPIAERSSVLQRTLLRGPFALADAVRIGTRALRVALRETTGVEPEARRVSMTFALVGIAVLGVFVVAPGVLLAGVQDAIADVLEALSRAGGLLVYLLAVSRTPAAQRLFAYHGAEHKVVAAFELTGAEPTLEEERAASPVHPRCGTAFMALFVIVAGAVFAFVPRSPAWAGAAWRVGLVPVVVVVAYETMRAAARTGTSVLSRLVSWPGRALQRITTREPSADQLEVAHTALRTLLADRP